jgi:cytochrome c oxidase subunit 2
MMDKMLHYIFPLPPLASAQGQQVDMLLYVLHILMLILLIGWSVFFIYVLLRFRKKESPKAQYAGLRSKFPVGFEIGVAAVEAVLLLGVSVPFWANRYVNIPEGRDVIQVAVVAEQFAWNFHYPGPDGILGRAQMSYYQAQTNPLGLDPNDHDGKDDFATINQMHLPVGRPCVLTLTSKDVVHSFTVPSMRVKQDVIPGASVRLWFTPVKEGTYDIICSQLCGAGHYRMRGVLTVESQAAYDMWIHEQGAWSHGQ